MLSPSCSLDFLPHLQTILLWVTLVPASPGSPLNSDFAEKAGPCLPLYYHQINARAFSKERMLRAEMGQTSLLKLE